MMQFPSLEDINWGIPAEHAFMTEPGFRAYVLDLLSRYPITSAPAPDAIEEWGDLYNRLSYTVKHHIGDEIRKCRLIPDIRLPSIDDLLSKSEHSRVMQVRVTAARPVLLEINFIDDILMVAPDIGQMLKWAVGVLISLCPVVTVNEWGTTCVYGHLTTELLQKSIEAFAGRVFVTPSPHDTFDSFMNTYCGVKHLLSEQQSRWCVNLASVAEEFRDHGIPLKAYSGYNYFPREDKEERESSRDIAHFYIIGNKDLFSIEYLEFVESTIRDQEYRGVFYMDLHATDDTERLFAVCRAFTLLGEILETGESVWSNWGKGREFNGKQ